MALFVVRHQHSAERCPAQDPYMGAMLLNHLSRPSVSQHGVKIQGEAVVQGEHTFYLIAEAADEDRLRAFMQPFQLAGSLDIYPASTCARVVASGGCAAALPSSDGVSSPQCGRRLPAGDRRRTGCPSRAPAQLRDVDPGAPRRRRDAECAVLRPQPLPDSQPGPGHLPPPGWRPCRPAPQPEPARPPQHAVADTRRHPGVRRQRPHVVPAAH